MKYLIKKSSSVRRPEQLLLLFLSIALFSGVSCRKYIDYVGSGYNRPNAECMLTHTEEDFFDMPFDFFYDQKGTLVSTDPDFARTIDYDKKGRMLRATFMTSGAHFDFSYKDNSFLPVEMKYYHPGTGGLVATDSFFYNIHGLMIRHDMLSQKHPNYNYSFLYEYDKNQNVSKIVMKASHGGIYYPEEGIIDFIGFKYDDKPNFLAGNQWLKYLYLYGGGEDIEIRMLSANNAVDWAWNWESTDEYNPTYTHAKFEYNSKGFATKVIQDYYDSDNETFLWTATKVNTSTCDVKKTSRNNFSSKQQNFQPQRKRRSLLPDIPRPWDPGNRNSK